MGEKKDQSKEQQKEIVATNNHQTEQKDQKKDAYIDQAKYWTTHSAKNGLTFYHNLKTDISTWEKPECLKSEEEKCYPCDWHELITQDGRLFYVNYKELKSMWKMPIEYRQYLQSQNEQTKKDSSNVQKVPDSKPSLRTIHEEDKLKEPVIHHTESTHLFVDMLKELGISASMKWDQVSKLIQHDPRSNVIKAISEKKKVFQDFVLQKRKEERSEVRTRIEETKENFFQMLRESGRLNSSSKYYKAAGQFIQDSRWKAVDERERELLFQDYLDDLLIKEKEEGRIQRKINMDKLTDILITTPNINHTITWHEYSQIFSEQPYFRQLNDQDRLIAFQDAILAMEQKENDENKTKRRNEERINREKFKELLSQYQKQGHLNHKSKWKSFVNLIKDDERLLNMLGQIGSTPKELFDDRVEDLSEQHKIAKEELKNYLKQVDFSPNIDTSFNEFISRMKQNSWFMALQENMKQFYYEYCIEKAKSKDKENKKKQKKTQKKLVRVLRNFKEINSNSQLSDFLQQINDNMDKIGSISDELMLLTFNQFKEGGEDAVFGDSDKKKKKIMKDKNKKSKKNKKKDDSDSDSDSDRKTKKYKVSEEKNTKIRVFMPEKEVKQTKEVVKDKEQNIEEGQILEEFKQKNDREEGEESPRYDRKNEKKDKRSKYDRDSRDRKDRRKRSRSKSKNR